MNSRSSPTALSISLAPRLIGSNSDQLKHEHLLQIRVKTHPTNLSWSIFALGPMRNMADANSLDLCLIYSERKKHHSICVAAVDPSSLYEQKIIEMLAWAFSSGKEGLPCATLNNWRSIQVSHCSSVSPCLPKLKMKIKRHKNRIKATTLISDTTQRYDAQYSADALCMSPGRMVIAALLEQLRRMGYSLQLITPHEEAKGQPQN
ncbi:MAG: hypothetical protein KUL86_05700 [Castellaniella sp.]|uniref:hypothetical protein n=1 Tax=unclassified Castellaniella TaxID=2617606 RepID=UPI003315CEDD|nr:hypothetical protein [Castellaniella sp.]